MFSLNSIGCVTKCGPAGILEGAHNRQMYVRLTCSPSSYMQKDEKYFKPLDEEQAHGATKMNKEQSADDPSVDLIRKKYA